MAFDLKKNALKMVLPMVTDFLPQLDPAIDDYKKSWVEKRPLLPGEDIVCIIFSVKGRTLLTVAVIDENNAVIQQLKTMSFSDFVTELIEAFKNS
jgi:hypothetical protein